MKKISTLLCAVALLVAAPAFATDAPNHSLTSGPVNKASRVLKFEDTATTTSNTAKVLFDARVPVDGALGVSSVCVSRETVGSDRGKGSACKCTNVVSYISGSLTADTATCACDDNGLSVTEDIAAGTNDIQVSVTGPSSATVVHTCYTEVRPVSAHVVPTTTTTAAPTTTTAASTTTTTLP